MAHYFDFILSVLLDLVNHFGFAHRLPFFIPIIAINFPQLKDCHYAFLV